MFRPLFTAGSLLVALHGQLQAFDDFYQRMGADYGFEVNEGGHNYKYYFKDGRWQGVGGAQSTDPGHQNLPQRQWNSPGVQNQTWGTAWGGQSSHQSWTQPSRSWTQPSQSWNNWQQPSQTWNGRPETQSWSLNRGTVQSWSAPSQPGYQQRDHFHSSRPVSTSRHSPVTYSRQPIRISMPEDQIGICAYVLRSGDEAFNYTILPGKKQDFTEDRAWKIVYDRGDGFGQQSYGLKPGHYRFRQSSRGWELYRSSSMETASTSNAPPPPM